MLFKNRFVCRYWWTVSARVSCNKCPVNNNAKEKKKFNHSSMTGRNYNTILQVYEWRAIVKFYTGVSRSRTWRNAKLMTHNLKIRSQPSKYYSLLYKCKIIDHRTERLLWNAKISTETINYAVRRFLHIFQDIEITKPTVRRHGFKTFQLISAIRVECELF